MHRSGSALWHSWQLWFKEDPQRSHVKTSHNMAHPNMQPLALLLVVVCLHTVVVRWTQASIYYIFLLQAASRLQTILSAFRHAKIGHSLTLMRTNFTSSPVNNVVSMKEAITWHIWGRHVFYYQVTNRFYMIAFPLSGLVMSSLLPKDKSWQWLSPALRRLRAGYYRLLLHTFFRVKAVH